MKSLLACTLLFSSMFAAALGAVSWNELLGDKIFPAHLDTSRSRSGHRAVLMKEFSGHLDDSETLNLLFNNYAKLYNKEENTINRQNIFKSNLVKIVRHNLEAEAGLHTWIEGTNQFTDLSDEEFERMYTGFSVNLTGAFESSGISSIDLDLEGVELTQSSEKDWNKEGFVGVPKDQGNCGSCYAFACAGTLESSVAIKQNSGGSSILDLSEQQIVDCSNNGGCNGGYWTNTYNYMKEGIVSENDYKYTKSRGSCDATKSSADKRLAKVANWAKIPADEDSLLAAVTKYGPVATAVDASRDWSRYRGGIFSGQCSTRQNHAVSTIGYTKDAIIIKNSWGAGWGEKGFIRMARKRNQCGVNGDNVWVEAA